MPRTSWLHPHVRGRVVRACAASLLASVFTPTLSRAADATPPTLPGVVVVGQRQVPGTPASIDRISVKDVPARPQLSVSELLERVPGVGARDRQNLAQDVQLTIRGFGARSAFGVRGLQVFDDGIPATMPDGQGQVSHIPLEAVARVEVLRGPFSALYGNASGGVIEFFSADPPRQPQFTLRASGGSDGLSRDTASVAGPWSDDAVDGEGYRLDAGHLDLVGYRAHSRARRDTQQARMVFGTTAGTKIAVTANRLDLAADDPQGLNLAQALATPRAASAGALAFDTRKRVRQQQAGLHVEQAIGDRNALSLDTWGGTRDTFQMLSVPVAAQAAPGSGGGVVDLNRGYAGIDLRWQLDTLLLRRPLGVTLGLESQRSTEHRRGYENFSGTVLGVVGALRRDQRDTVGNRDAYAEARWAFATQWAATLGVRRSRVDFRSRDAYIAPGNPDDSGRLHYARTTPVFGISYRPRSWLELYGNAGRGFETPSFAELGYRADGGSGLNGALRPARSTSAELGMRVNRGEHAFELVTFDSRTRDELVVASNVGGRSTYDNAASSGRRGWELSASGPLSQRWHYAVAYSRLDARYRSAFSTCRAPPCTQPDTFIAAGNRIPATTPQTLWAELRWTPGSDLDLFAQAAAFGRTYADDANSAHAPGYATLDLGAERRWRIGRMRVEGFARLDNVFDRHAIGSLIVNDSNGRYFEPAPGRTWMFGLSLASANR
ncbi:MAG TPA: TonB-dependent receptor [Luteimonas sp.]|nr:TonB-dependent receptor [Luteimonas sp.]